MARQLHAEQHADQIAYASATTGAAAEDAMLQERLMDSSESQSNLAS